MPDRVKLAKSHDLPDLLACDPLAQQHPERAAWLKQALQQHTVLIARAAGTDGGASRAIGFLVLESASFFGRPFVPLVCVHESKRRMGVGTALLQVAQERMRTDLFTSTNQSNPAAQGMLQKAGFVPSGQIQNLDPDDLELVYYKDCR